VKLGSRREYGKLSSDWTKRSEEDLPATEYEDPAGDPDSQPASYTARVLETQPSLRSDEYTSVLGAESTWKGNISSEGSIRIDGNAQGEVRATGTVLISQGAEVKATVYGKYVVIAGSFDGELYCSDRLELQPQSRIKGVIHTKALSVGEGAFIDGEIHMGDVDELVASGPLRASARPARNGSSKKEEAAVATEAEA
jgi:cytoskeletal protein CcmA (bactofilin family)